MFIEKVSNQWVSLYNEFIINNINLLDINELSGNLNVKLNFILTNSHIKWNMYKICRRADITIDIVLLYPYIKWDISNLMTNKNITLDHIKNTPHLNWDMNRIYTNPNITYNDIVNNHNDNKLYMIDLSKNMNITLDIIKKYNDIEIFFNILLFLS